MKRRHPPAEAAAPSAPSASLWQEVYVPEAPARARWLVAALAAASFVVLAALLAWRSEPTTADWAAEMALRIHASLDDDRAVTLESPPAVSPRPPAPPPEAPSPSRAPSRDTPRSVRSPARSLSTASPPAGPVRAAALAGAAPADEPLDFSAMGFVAGTATSPVSGAVAAGAAPGARGVSPDRGSPSGAGASGAAAAVAGRSRAVSLAEDAWDCAWPSSADEHERDQATVELSVRVGVDGRVAAVRVLRDPGLGFGDAARACALRTAFQPARDDAGAAVIAWSPPIRVTFRR